MDLYLVSDPGHIILILSYYYVFDLNSLIYHAFQEHVEFVFGILNELPTSVYNDEKLSRMHNVYKFFQCVLFVLRHKCLLTKSLAYYLDQTMHSCFVLCIDIDGPMKVHSSIQCVLSCMICNVSFAQAIRSIELQQSTILIVVANEKYYLRYEDASANQISSIDVLVELIQ